jgi:glycine cleavage system H protein
MDKPRDFIIDTETYTIPDDRLYSRENHMWAMKDSAGIVTVGMDALGLAALGDLAYVILPPVGTQVQRGKSMGTLEAAKMTGGLIAPLSGKIVARNDAAVHNPSLVNQEMYGRGWLVQLQPSDWEGETKLLVSGDELPGWVDAELDRYRRQGWID